MQQNDNSVVLTAKGGSGGGLTWGENFVAGGIAGVTSRTFTSPLDVIKILFQVQRAPIKGDAAANAAAAAEGRTVYTGFFSAFGTIYREEGLKGFWKGNLIACVRLFPYSAIKFAAFDFLKGFFGDEKGKLTVSGNLTAGATAGVIATVATYPLDLIKTRLTIQKEGHGPKTYNGAIDAFGKILKEEGVAGLYRGVSTSVLGAIPFEGGTFMAYEFLKKLSGDGKISAVQDFINGCLAAAFSQTFSYPFDLVRKRLQAQSKAKGMLKEEYSGMMDCFTKIAKQEGILALYKGTSANLAKVGPYAGIAFMTWEQCKEFFLWYNKTYSYGPIHGPKAEKKN